MSAKEEIIEVCAYFFEVLVKKFLEIETTIRKQSGLLSVFKKINYLDRANTFNGLLERAMEAKNGMTIDDGMKEDYEIFSFAAKLTECLAIYISMIESQVNLNIHLNQKANGEKYSWNEYTKCLKLFEMERNALENELPKLHAIYAVILKSDNTGRMGLKEEINEIELAEIVISQYLTQLENDFDDILASFLELGFDENDFEDKNSMKYDIFLCGLTFDGMALFNLLENTQADRIFNYISVEKFIGFLEDEQRSYCINSVSEYKSIWDYCIEKREPPFDFIYSKLFEDLLGENIQKYNIGPLHMLQIMSLVTPIFAGKWKTALEHYEPIK